MGYFMAGQNPCSQASLDSPAHDNLLLIKKKIVVNFSVDYVFALARFVNDERFQFDFYVGINFVTASGFTNTADAADAADASLDD